MPVSDLTLQRRVGHLEQRDPRPRADELNPHDQLQQSAGDQTQSSSESHFARTLCTRTGVRAAELARVDTRSTAFNRSRLGLDGVSIVLPGGIAILSIVSRTSCTAAGGVLRVR
jgi:hypothetical protein